MQTSHLKLVTIITEAALEAEIVKVIEKLGASGYTITNARGKGSRGVRDAGWANSSNIRVEVICSEELSESLRSYLNENFYDHYAMVVFESNVGVLRKDKFS